MATALHIERDVSIEAVQASPPIHTVSSSEPTARTSAGVKAAKRGLDVVIAALLLLAIAPLFLLIVLLIQLEAPGTPFYRARRVGYRGRPLYVLKFRKMPLDARGLPLTLAQDARLTRIGAFMTRTRIDELPQLWNVLRGQMSLVGPRPEDPQFVALHADSYEHILTVRPGITGWSQLAYAAESQILDQADPVAHYVDRILPAKVGLDCKYAERPRLGHDIKVIAWTAAAMLIKVEVAVHRDTGGLSRRRRPRHTSDVRAHHPPRVAPAAAGATAASD